MQFVREPWEAKTGQGRGRDEYWGGGRGRAEYFLPEDPLQVKDGSFETRKCFEIKELVLGWEMESRRTSDGSGLVLKETSGWKLQKAGNGFSGTFQ